MTLTPNLDPIKVVTGARRRPWRCEHEDGRGRCTRTDTALAWNASEKRAEALCGKHARA